MPYLDDLGVFVNFKLGALPQVSSTVSHAMPGQGMFMVALLALALVAVVALTAIWSADESRRTAALAVLDRLIRWHYKRLKGQGLFAKAARVRA